MKLKRKELFQLATILSTIASLLLIASGIYISNVNSLSSRLTQINMFIIENYGKISENDMALFRSQQQTLKHSGDNSLFSGILLVLFGFLLIIFSFCILTSLTNGITKKVLIIFLILLIIIALLIVKGNYHFIVEEFPKIFSL